MLREAPMARTFRDIFGFFAVLQVQFIGGDMWSHQSSCIMRQAAKAVAWICGIDRAQQILLRIILLSGKATRRQALSGLRTGD